MKVITDKKGNLWCVPCTWPRERDPKLYRGMKPQPSFNGISLDPVLLQQKTRLRVCKRPRPKARYQLLVKLKAERLLIPVRSCPPVIDRRQRAGLIVDEFSYNTLRAITCKI